jgi:monoamine oxidase
MDQCVARQNPPLSAQELRTLNWHYANLEYANAVNLNQLSLGGWDQDSGNEFEGRHSEVKGGYSQLPRALMRYPTPLDVKLGRAVKDICYRADGASRTPAATIHCENGEVFDADYVVSTLPLGVMKEHKISFHPPLPAWKSEPVQRLGFGVLNKVSQA